MKITQQKTNSSQKIIKGTKMKKLSSDILTEYWESIRCFFAFYPIFTIIFIAATIFLSSLHMPTWFTIVGAIIGWWYISCILWSYECWRASGPRGIYWNPADSPQEGKTILIWLMFGIFISLAHSISRREWGDKLIEKYEKQLIWAVVNRKL